MRVLSGFLLRWMEDVEEDGFGFPAAAIKDFRRHLYHDRVIDVRRRFPRHTGFPPSDP